MYCLVKDMKNLLEIEKFAKDNYIPIARRQTIEYITSLIKEKNYSSFLEIGTAIGYSTINVSLIEKPIKIVTIEHDLKRAIIAKKNFIDFNVEDKIQLIIGDAEEISLNEKFDLIFIDASKKKNKLFLNSYSKNLSTNGTIIIDNMNLKDFWGEDADIKKVDKFQKITNEFKDYLLSLNEFDVKIYEDIGDGIATIKKKRI